MSRIVELIAELCPDGVEYKRLSEMGKFVRGKRFVWKDVVPDGKPCIHYSELYTTYGLATKKTVSHLDEGKYEKLRFANPGDVVIVGAGETVEDIGIGVAWLGTEPAAVHDACYIYKHGDTLDPVFISYYLRSGFYHNQITRFVSSAKISSISADNLGRALIPVPPIEVQREVVRILDTFTELTDELTAKLAEEVTARKQQYAYYRDRLLSRESLEALDGKPVEMVKLGKTCLIETGKLNAKAATENGAYCFFTTAEEVSKIDTYRWDTEALLIAGNANVGSVKHFKGKFEAYQRTYVLTQFVSDIQPRYLYHYLEARLKDYLVDKSNSAAMTYIVLSTLQSFPIPVPSLATQQKVIDILDRFDALTTSLTDGLPAEIEARRQQYEYYRDYLLDFPRKSGDAA